MLYILAHRYFASDRILRSLDPKLPIRLIYIEPVAKKHPLLWLWLLMGEAIMGINFFSRRYHPVSHYEAIRQIRTDDRVLIFDVWDICGYIATAKNMSSRHRCLWLWNTAFTLSKSEKRRRIAIRILQRWMQRIYTFDFGDADRYGLMFKEQLYCREVLPAASAEEPVDLFFVGVEKGRLETLVALCESARAEELSTFFHIVPGRGIGAHPPHLHKYLATASISYDETLAHITRAQALVEIVAPGQQGSTLRAMEALFFGKKLITDNPAVERETFYRPENIYRLGRETRTLRQFLDEPAVPLPREIIDIHEVNHWIEVFFE